MKLERINEIIDFARDLRHTWGDDPFIIANKMGINVFRSPGSTPEASTIKLRGYGTMIRIVGCKDEISEKMLCAHELGHAFLHDELIYRFNGSDKDMTTKVEYEANLFAVAYIFDDGEFVYPISKMSSYTLQSILEHNIHR